MKKMAKMAMALGALLVFLMLFPTVDAQAYTFSDTSGTLTVSYETQIVVPKGSNKKLTVKAKTTDKHTISYRWSKIKETDKVDENGNTLWAVSSLKDADKSTYTVQKMTEDMSFYCEVWCDDNNSCAIFEDIYVGDVLQLNEPETLEKTGDSYCEKYFVFTPSESGTYMFRSSGTVEARLCVFNDLQIDSSGMISTYTSNAESDGQYGKNGGTATAELTAGKTYAIQAYIAASDEGAYSVTALKYVDTDFYLSAKKTTYNVDDKSGSTTMKVKSTFSGKAKNSDKLTYQWYVYDPIDWDYVPVEGATSASLTVANKTLKWRETLYRCDAVDSYGQSDSIYFTLCHDTGWNTGSNDYDERVTYNTAATLSVLTGETHDILNAEGEWISEEFVEDGVKRSYQWYILSYDDSYYGGDKFKAIKGATSSTYKTAAVTGNERYMCVVTDSSGYSDYRQYYVRPDLMDVSVDQTYYSIKSGKSQTIAVAASEKYKDTQFDYTWYKGVVGQVDDEAGTDSGFLNYVEVERWSGKSSVKLSSVTQTQYIRCQVKATARKNGESITDYVEVDFVVDPGTGYYKMYTTSGDKNVKGASLKASSTTKKNKNGTTTTVTTMPDGTTSKTTVKEKANGSTVSCLTKQETNSAGKTVDVSVTTKKNAKGKVTSITEEYTIAKATSSDSVVITVEKNAKGKVTSAAAEVTKVSESNKSVITDSLISQIIEAAGETTTNVVVTMNVIDHKDRAQYTVVYDAVQIDSGKTMYLYSYNSKKNICKVVDKKTYSLGKKGKLTISQSKNATYVLSKSAEDALALVGDTTIIDESTPLASGTEKSSEMNSRIIFVITIVLLLILIRIIYAIIAIKNKKNTKLR